MLKMCFKTGIGKKLERLPDDLNKFKFKSSKIWKHQWK